MSADRVDYRWENLELLFSGIGYSTIFVFNAQLKQISHFEVIFDFLSCRLGIVGWAEYPENDTLDPRNIVQKYLYCY